MTKYLAAALTVIGLAGCTLSLGDSQLSLMQLAPSDTVRTVSSTVIGAEVLPGEGTLRLGYVRSIQNNTPVTEPDAYTPDVEINTSFTPDGTIREAYRVGQHE